MMNRSVLIITPFFAPQSHAAVFRAYKLAKYLPQHGWKVYVVTTDTNYLYNEDMRLLDALSDSVEIHRTRYIEPSIRGLRMALGGEDRTFKTIKANTKQNSTTITQTNNTPEPLSLFSRMYGYLRDTWLYAPDRHWTWESSAVRQATKLIQEHNIPIILTSALPYTSYRIGYRVKQLTGVRWVADFRDPATHAKKMISKHNHVFLKQRELEQLAVNHADMITASSLSYEFILTEMYGLSNDHPIQFITTGLDTELLGNEEITLPEFPYFVFIGEYIPSYDDGFFRVFSQCLKNPEIAKTGIKLLIIGNMSLNQPRVQPIINKYGLEGSVEFIDHLPQQELYQYLQNAKATLLVPGKRSMWWNLFAKLVDYIALRKPTIAIVPDLSESRTHLEKSGLGIFLDGEDDHAVKILSDFILSDDTSLNINAEYCDQFLVQSQVKSFIDIFERLQ